MTPLLVLNIVGLTRALLARFPGRARHLEALAADGSIAGISSLLPAVTCPVQATYLTGLLPRDHGIVANGWYFRDLAEIHFWKQSHSLMAGEKLWQTARQRFPGFTSAQICWWFNMYSDNDLALTMRPYEDGDRVVSLLYTRPAPLAEEIQANLGPFPLFDFWGPRASIHSSHWIANATAFLRQRFAPTLTLVYLPHLDYNLQRLGPDDPRIGDDLAAIDHIAGTLLDAARAQGAEAVVLSEYGIQAVQDAVPINRILRQAGYLAVQKQLSWELLDAGASRAFAVADHQVAHVYVAEPRDLLPVRRLLEKVPGIARVLDRSEMAPLGLDHPRSGELLVLSEPDRWLSYYHWLSDSAAPPWARQVDIHRKPGYDPLELFMDPDRPLKLPRIMARLALRKLGWNVGPIMNFVPLDTTLIRGSHGLMPREAAELPVLISSRKGLPEHILATQVKEVLLQHLAQDALGI